MQSQAFEQAACSAAWYAVSHAADVLRSVLAA